MGLFDKLKGAASAITGGAAHVTVTVGEFTRGQEGQAVVRCQAKDAEVKYDRIYLKVRGIEHVEVRDRDMVAGHHGDVHTRVEVGRGSRETFGDEIAVAPGGVLAANEVAEWTVSFTIPESANGAYDGILASHHYELFAGMDCWGNDPDSGWVQFHVW